MIMDHPLAIGSFAAFLVLAFLMITVPGAVLRQIVRLYPPSDPRRRELIAELYGVPFAKRWLFVAQALELATFEGIPRRHAHRSRRQTVVASSRRPPTSAFATSSFRGPQVCSIVGITYRQLDYWARTGLMHPSISAANGSGSSRVYSYTDLVQLKVIKRLLDCGVSLQAAREAIDCLRTSGEDLARANLAINGKQSVLTYSGDEIIHLLEDGKTVINVVPLGGIVSEIATAIESLKLEPPEGSRH